MKYSILLFLFVGAIYHSSIAQTKQAIYAEFLGNGGLYSINYEKSVFNQCKARIGFAWWKSKTVINGRVKSRYTVSTVPILFSVVTNGRLHHFESGLGMTFGFITNEDNDQIANISSFIGYRLQKNKSGFLLRLGFTPFYELKGDYPDDGFVLSAGISVGYHF